MALETANVVNDLVITNPTSTDPKSQGDDHIRTLKKAIKQTLNGFTGAALVTATDVGDASIHVLNPTTALLSYTPMLCLLYIPAHTNTGMVAVNVSSLGYVFIKTLYGADPTAGDIVAGVPLLLMYNGTNFITLSGSEFLSKTGNQTLNGNLNVTGDELVSGMLTVGNDAIIYGDVAISGMAYSTTANVGDNSAALATTAFVTTAVAGENARALGVEATLAPLISPNLQGTPRTPTMAVGDNSTIIANTAFIATAIQNEANRATAADAVIAANVGSALGINFGSFYLIDGELNVAHLSTSSPSLVNGDLILTYESL